MQQQTTWTQLFVGFLGGGLVSALINLVRSNSSERKQRRIAHLQAQLTGLYGPLHILLLKSGSFVSLSKRYLEAWEKELVSRTEQAGTETAAQFRAPRAVILGKIERETDLTYNQLSDTLTTGSMHIDLEDMQYVVMLQQAIFRWRHEWDAGVQLIPDAIMEHMGGGGMAEIRTHFQHRFEQKQKALRDLIGD